MKLAFFVRKFTTNNTLKLISKYVISIRIILNIFYGNLNKLPEIKIFKKSSSPFLEFLIFQWNNTTCLNVERPTAGLFKYASTKNIDEG